MQEVSPLVEELEKQLEQQQLRWEDELATAEQRIQLLERETRDVRGKIARQHVDTSYIWPVQRHGLYMGETLVYCWANGVEGLLLGQRRKRWANSKLTFVGMPLYPYSAALFASIFHSHLFEVEIAKTISIIQIKCRKYIFMTYEN